MQTHLDKMKTLVENNEQFVGNSEVREMAAAKLVGGMFEKPFFMSKKWWASILALLIPICNRVFDLNLNVEDMTWIITPVLIYVCAQGVADLGKNK